MHLSPLAFALMPTLAMGVAACPVDLDRVIDRHDGALSDAEVEAPTDEGEGEGEIDRVPAGWTCDDSYYDDTDCDCGCGVRDPTCAAGTGCTTSGCFDDACDFCFIAGEVDVCVVPPPPTPRCGACSVDGDCQSGNCRTYIGQVDDDAICMVGCGSDAQCQGNESCVSGLCVARQLSDVDCADADTVVRVDAACDRSLLFACAARSLCVCTLSEGNTRASSCIQATCRAHCQACTGSADCPAGDSCRFFTGFEGQGSVCVPPCTIDDDCGSLGRCLQGFCGELGANRCAGTSVVRDDQCGRPLVVEACQNGCNGGACNP